MTSCEAKWTNSPTIIISSRWLNLRHGIGHGVQRLQYCTRNCHCGISGTTHESRRSKCARVSFVTPAPTLERKGTFPQRVSAFCTKLNCRRACAWDIYTILTRRSRCDENKLAILIERNFGWDLHPLTNILGRRVEIQRRGRSNDDINPLECTMFLCWVENLLKYDSKVR